MKNLLLLLCLLLYLNNFAQEKIIIDTEGKYKEAVEHLNNFRYQKAIESLSFCYIEDQQNLDILGKMGFCHYQSGNYKEAKLFFQQALNQDSLNVNSLSYLGTIAEREYNYNQAQHYYQQLIEIDSTNSYYFKQNGFIANKRRDLLGAIGYFEMAHYHNRFDVVSIYELSKLHIRIDNPGRADTLLEKGFKIDSTNIKILQARGQLKHDLKDYEATTIYLEKMMDNGDSTTYFLKLLGNAYVNLKEFEKAVAVLTPILEKTKDTEMIHYYLALAYQGLEQETASIEQYELAIDAGISKNVKYYYQNLGTIFEAKNQTKNALNAYRNAYEYSGKAEDLFRLAKMSDVYYKDKNIAIRHYKNYLKTNDKKYQEYVENRLGQLKELQHFQGKK